MAALKIEPRHIHPQGRLSHIFRLLSAVSGQRAWNVTNDRIYAHTHTRQSHLLSPLSVIETETSLSAIPLSRRRKRWPAISRGQIPRSPLLQMQFHSKFMAPINGTSAPNLLCAQINKVPSHCVEMRTLNTTFDQPEYDKNPASASNEHGGNPKSGRPREQTAIDLLPLKCFMLIN